MRHYIIMVFLFALILIVGCTHTVDVPLLPDFNSNVYSDNELSNIKPAIKFVKGKFSDKRAEIGKLATFKQQVHTYNLYAERPIDEALFEGLAVLITLSDHKWIEKETGEVQIDLQLLSVQASRHAGFVNVGATSSIQIKLDFIDQKTDDIIYSQVYNGTDERQQALIGLMDLVIKSIDASIIDCINSVGDDESLARALKKFIL